jgi:hypothetical protein
VYEDACTAVDIEGNLHPLYSNCDPYDGANDGCGLNTNGGYTLALFGDNFGDPEAGIQSVYFGETELEHKDNNPAGLEVVSEVHYVSHNEIHIKVPAGVGMNIPIVVKVGDRASDAVEFSYDPP